MLSADGLTDQTRPRASARAHFGTRKELLMNGNVMKVGVCLTTPARTTSAKALILEYACTDLHVSPTVEAAESQRSGLHLQFEGKGDLTQIVTEEQRRALDVGRKQT